MRYGEQQPEPGFYSLFESVLGPGGWPQIAAIHSCQDQEAGPAAKGLLIANCLSRRLPAGVAVS
jgi:hypothetical protein